MSNEDVIKGMYNKGITEDPEGETLEDILDYEINGFLANMEGAILHNKVTRRLFKARLRNLIKGCPVCLGREEAKKVDTLMKSIS